MVVTGREQVETKTYHKSCTTWGDIQKQNADDSELFLPCETTKPPKSPCRTLLMEPKWFTSFWFPYFDVSYLGVLFNQLHIPKS